MAKERSTWRKEVEDWLSPFLNTVEPWIVEQAKKVWGNQVVKKVFDARGRDEVDNRLETWIFACVIPFIVVPLIYCQGVVMAINDGPKGYKSLGY